MAGAPLPGLFRKEGLPLKIKTVIQMARLMEPGDVMPDELAIMLLSELDGMIQSDIMLLAPEEIVSYTDPEQELLLRPPHDGVYLTYLMAMIRQMQQEYEGYQNAQASFDDKLSVFRRWYISHYRPADTRSRSYIGGGSAGSYGFAYLSAYGTAVKLGFVGTEEEWLESLEGEAGAPAVMRYDADAKMVQWSNDGANWTDLMSLAELIDPVTGAVLEEARAAAESAADHARDTRAMLQDAEAAAGAAAEAAEEAKQAAASSGGGVKATVSVVDGIQVVTAAAGAVTVTVVDGIQTVA